MPCPSGTRCAILCDEEFPAPDGLVLREPLKAENLIGVLRQASTPSVQAAAVNAVGEDFYFRDLADFRSEAPSTARDEWAQRSTASSGLDDVASIDPPIHNPVAEGLEALIKAERQRAEVPAVKRMQLAADTGIAATASPSAVSNPMIPFGASSNSRSLASY